MIAENPTPLIEAMVRRVSQIWLRMILAACMVAGFFLYVGGTFILLWGIAYFAVQIGEYLVFSRDKLVERLSTRWGRTLAMTLVVVSNLIFAAFTFRLAMHGGVAMVCAAFLVAGTAFNSILTVQHHTPMAWAGVGPTVASAIGLPVAILISGGSPLDAAMLAFAIVLFAVILRQAWSLAHQLTVMEGAARQATEAADFAKGRFVANISHELRTPLNGVIASASLLQGSDLAPRERELVDHLIFASHNLQALIGDILDASKAESGHMELSSEAFRPGEAVHRTVELHRATAESKGLDFQIDLSGVCAWALGDALRICQVIGNLTSNAIKFTTTGSIRIAIEVQPQGSDVRLRVEIADSGIGMSPETAANIFKPFVQADASITREYGGTGLGLSICRILADLMEADLVVESEPGVGSVFRFDLTLPAASADQIAAVQHTLQTDGAPRRTDSLRLLVVDDHPANRRLMELILEGDNDIVTAANGQEALDVLRGATFDMIITDMQMPVMDGPTLISAVRALEREHARPRLPILLATADAAMTEAQAKTLGADGVVTKPFTAEGLFEAVDRRWTDHLTTIAKSAPSHSFSHS